MRGLSLALSALLVSVIPAWPADEPQPAEQLADVLTLPFINDTGKKQYDWLSKNVPAAVVESMKEKFRFNLLTKERIDADLAKSKKLKSLDFTKLITEKEASEICAAVRTDILIYGNYAYNAADKTVGVNAYIFHRSRGKTTGNIDMVTPVTSEMFKMVDKVADATIAHIAEVAAQDSAGTTVEPGKAAVPGGKKEDDRIVLVKRDAPVSKPWYYSAGLTLSAPLTYFDSGLSGGLGITGGFMNSYASFWHYGASASLLVHGGNEDESFNMIETMIFLPVTATGGINYRVTPGIIIQPFLGAGLSFEAMKVGKEKVLFNGAPVREGDFWSYYLDPCFVIGLRVPIIWRQYLVAPFMQVYIYAGKGDGENLDLGTLFLLGVQGYM
jgi:hypothetical protein